MVKLRNIAKPIQGNVFVVSSEIDEKTIQCLKRANELQNQKIIS